MEYMVRGDISFLDSKIRIKRHGEALRHSMIPICRLWCWEIYEDIIWRFSWILEPSQSSLVRRQAGVDLSICLIHVRP